MLAYKTYSNQTDLKRDQAAHFRAAITRGQTQPPPRLTVDLADCLDINCVAMGQLALGHLHGIAEELVFTCRSGKSASGVQRVGDKGIWIVAIAGAW